MQDISLKELQDWKAEGRSFHLIDVREPAEHSSHNVGGTLVPLGEIRNYTDQLPTDRPVVVYCKRGIRSQLAIQRWRVRRPEVQFYNLRGGIGTGR